MEKELEADSLFQVLIKLFYTVFGIDNLSQVRTELKEILAESVRIDAVVTFPDNFDFTKLRKRILPWLGKNNIFEYKGEFDWLKVGQYFQYAFVELGLMLTRSLSKERKDRSGREWLSQKGVREYWNKLRGRGAKYLCTTTILSTGDAKGIRKRGGFKPVTQYPHLRDALYRRVIYQDEFIGTVVVYLVVLNKLKICAINAPLLLLSTGKKLNEFCQWLVTDPEGLAVEEQVAYKTLILTYNIVEDKEMKEQMGRKVWKPDYDKLAGYLHEGMPPEIREKFVQAFLGVDSPEEAVLKLAKTKEQQKKLLELLQRNLEESGQ